MDSATAPSIGAACPSVNNVGCPQPWLWSWPIGLIGLILGMLIVILFVWIFYVTRTFIFSYCAGTQPPCFAEDYYANPGEAIANGAKLEDILFIKDDQLLYKRVPKRACVPGDNQTVVIENPEYCIFHGADNIDYTVKSQALNASDYMFRNMSGVDISVNTSGDCIPRTSTNSFVTRGTVSTRWDPSQP
jgi:hypothetical protein